MTDKPKKIMFAPGVLEDLEEQFDPEELQEIMNEIKTAFDDGNFLDTSNAVDMSSLAVNDPELFQILKQRIELLDELPYEPTEKRMLH